MHEGILSSDSYRLSHGKRLYLPGIITRDLVSSRDPKGRGMIQVEGDDTWEIQPLATVITYLSHDCFFL